jgi:PTS system nitrogen regulatory IIA component
MYLTVDEISRILRTSRSTVEQWIARMGLPVEEHKGERRCHAEELRRWLSKRKIAIPDELMKTPSHTTEVLPSFADALERGGIFHNLPGRDKRTALAAAVGYLPLPESVPDEMLLQRLLDREEIVSTGVGDGIAIPHPRDPLPQLPMPLAMLCFPEKPLDFDAVDGLPVYALFVTASPTPKIHLHILARLFFLLRKPEFRGLIIPATPAELIITEARRMEKALK